MAAAEARYPFALKAGSILNGRYIVGRVLGQGGFGITYVAQDDKTKALVAIKEYYPSEFAARAYASCAVDPVSGDRRENFEFGRQKFLDEAKTLAAFLGDEHIVRIHNYFEENGTAYFAMEYVDGQPLDKYMKTHGGRLTPQEADALLLPLMGALEEVHAKGIVHRDIAPDNIIVQPDGTAKLIDFGAARYSTGEKSKSLDIVIKHGFAPKEQYMRRGRQGPFTDVYAMAATYYYAITGRIPPEAIERMDEDELIPPENLGVRLSDKAEAALYKALAVSAPDRFQTMAEFREAMRDPEAERRAREAEERRRAEEAERARQEAERRRAEEERRRAEAERLAREAEERRKAEAAEKARIEEERRAAKAAEQERKERERAEKKAS
ncbi:MAG: serine/threonine protein kinase, partial [Clostridia bacterium]|nr:serine/threonine protein kinase [Clostridia bacterium]